MPWLARLAVAWAINAAALWAADALWGSVRIHGWAAYLIGSAVLGIANTVLKPVLALLTLPLIIVTLGFAYLAINIAMVALAEWIAPNFSIDGFWTYVGVVVVVWAVNWIGREVVDRIEEGTRRPRILRIYRRARRNIVGPPGARCSPRCGVLGRARSLAYERSLRPCHETSITRQSARFPRTGEAPVYLLPRR